MKFTGPIHRQSHMVEGVAIRAGDFDALLSEALRVALGIDDSHGARDNFDERYDRIDRLLRAYVRSPEGLCEEGTDAAMLMVRLAISIIDVIPLAERRLWAR